ncbi:MAG: glycosyltransferase family 4 protein [Gemmatimonadota bacterium]|nr:glycosyltransferase family 4 protein [Gemmatimonadota bacterium]
MRLALFFTFEMSLKKWDQAGILDRELALYRRLAEHGVQADLITYGDTDDLEYAHCLGPGLEVHPCFTTGSHNKWMRFFLSWLAPLKYRKILHRADLVKTKQMWGSWSGLLSKVLLGKKWVLRCGFEHHRFLLLQGAGLRDRVFSRILGWLGYRIADVVIWSNEADRRWAVEHFSLRADDPRFRLVPNYVDTGLFKPAPPGVAGTGKTGKKILTVSRLDRQKNLESLIIALQNSEYELEIAGEGPLRGKLEEMARSLGVKTTFSGRLPQDRIAVHMAENHIFALCSHYEGLPKALLEAMSCALAVVGTNVPGIREVITDGHNGLLCETDPISIRKAIDRLAANEGLCASLGARARSFITANYSLDLAAREELCIYEELLQPETQA